MPAPELASCRRGMPELGMMTSVAASASSALRRSPSMRWRRPGRIFDRATPIGQPLKQVIFSVTRCPSRGPDFETGSTVVPALRFRHALSAWFIRRFRGRQPGCRRRQWCSYRWVVVESLPHPPAGSPAAAATTRWFMRLPPPASSTCGICWQRRGYRDLSRAWRADKPPTPPCAKHHGTGLRDPVS